jgi:hypothetical protein
VSISSIRTTLEVSTMQPTPRRAQSHRLGRTIDRSARAVARPVSQKAVLDERSMRIVELLVAGTVLVAAALLPLAR